jgi:beta-glucosidase-like glycosyl hydrolase
MSISATSYQFLSDMSLRDRIAQLIFVRIGSNLPPVQRVEADEERVSRLLNECAVGGLILFNGGPGTQETLVRLQSASRVPLLVGSDIERGVGQQVQGYTLFPHLMAFGRPNASLAFFMEAMVREARDVGIHIVFGPVADINTNPFNPIISIRAFGEDTENVAVLTSQYVKMAEQSGLLSTAKHFPGHGDTYQDSHHSLPSIDLSLDDLRRRELIPFQAAIDSGCSLIMTAHISFPRIDPSGLPATLSPILLKNVLRDEMGFRGVVCSDSLLMAGVRDRFATEGEMALAALNAGVDVLLDLEGPIEVIDYLVTSVEAGELDIKRVDEALQRVCSLKHRVFAEPAPKLPEPQGRWAKMPHSELFASMAKVAAKTAVDAIDVSRPTLPLNANLSLVAILLKPFETALEPPEQPFGVALRERFRDVKYVQLGPRADADAYRAARDLANGAKQLVVAMIVRPAAWHSYGLRPEQVEFARQLVRERDDVVLVSLGAPYALADYPEAVMRICTYSDVPVSQQALAEFLLTDGSPMYKPIVNDR